MFSLLYKKLNIYKNNFLLLGSIFTFLYHKIIHYFDKLLIEKEDLNFKVKSNDIHFTISPYILKGTYNIILFADDEKISIHYIHKHRKTYIYGLPFSPSSMNKNNIKLFIFDLKGDQKEYIFNLEEKIIL